MKTPEQMTDEELLQSRTIVSRVMIDDGYDVMLSCGHGAQFVWKPHIFDAPCPQCIDVFLERRRNQVAPKELEARHEEDKSEK